MTLLISNFVDLFVISAPWLLLGLIIAGFMKWLLPQDFLHRQLGKQNLGSIVKAALIGAPLPLCSCGVIPAALGLHRSGASKASSVSFLVATPETGVDSVSVSYALLGPFMAIARPFAAISSAIYAGLIVSLLTKNDAEKVTQPAQVETCCGGKSQNQTSSSSSMTVTSKVVEALKFASGKLLKDITPWLLIGLVIAAVIRTWVPMDFLLAWGDSFFAMLVMALIGIPMYICATASTPIAAGFLAAGISPGGVLVFMLAGPATNLSTMGMIRQEMGNSVLMAYLFSILSASIGLGYLLNMLVSTFDLSIYGAVASGHEMDHSILVYGLAMLLSILMIKNYIKT